MALRKMRKVRKGGRHEPTLCRFGPFPHIPHLPQPHLIQVFRRKDACVKRIAKRKQHKPWCAIHLPSIGRCDCWYDDDDDGLGPRRPRRPRPLAGTSRAPKKEKEMEDA